MELQVPLVLRQVVRIPDISLHLSSVFWWLNLVRLYSLYKILYPKRKIYSYSIMGTIISPNEIQLTWDFKSHRDRLRENLQEEYPKPLNFAFWLSAPLDGFSVRFSCELSSAILVSALVTL